MPARQERIKKLLDKSGTSGFSASDLVGMKKAQEAPTLVDAIYSGNRNLLEAFLASAPDLNTPDEHGYTPLMHAILASDADPGIVKLLLGAGAKPNVAEPKEGFTPLHFAARDRHPRLVKLLLDAGANPNAANYYGNTPIFVSEFSGSYPASEDLLHAGADPTQKNTSGVSMLDLARMKKAQEKIDIRDYVANPVPAPAPASTPASTPVPDTSSGSNFVAELIRSLLPQPDYKAFGTGVAQQAAKDTLAATIPGLSAYLLSKRFLPRPAAPEDTSLEEADKYYLEKQKRKNLARLLGVLAGGAGLATAHFAGPQIKSRATEMLNKLRSE